MTIEEFGDFIMGDLVIKRYANQNNRYTAYFEGAKIKEHKRDIMLRSISGEGSTAWSAVVDYVKRIRGKIIVLDVMTNYRRMYGVPHNLEV